MTFDIVLQEMVWLRICQFTLTDERQLSLFWELIVNWLQVLC